MPRVMSGRELNRFPICTPPRNIAVKWRACLLAEPSRARSKEREETLENRGHGQFARHARRGLGASHRPVASLAIAPRLRTARSRRPGLLQGRGEVWNRGDIWKVCRHPAVFE